MNSSSNRSGSSLILTCSVILVAVAFLLYGATLNETVAVAGPSPTSSALASPAATFPGANLGAIVDGTSTNCWNPGVVTPRDVTFSATGLSGSPTRVDVSMTFGSPIHTYVGDILAVLIAPNGASHTIFGRTLATTATGFGDSSDLAGPYTFSNTAPSPPNGGWWQAASAAGTAVALPTGTYRTTASGGAGATNPQPPTDINAAFAGVSNPNGTWTLRLSDGCGGDTGSVTAASLTIETVVRDANVDMNGDGRTDYVVARGTTTPLAETDQAGARPGRRQDSSLEERPTSDDSSATPESPQVPPLYWYTMLSSSGATSVVQLGDAATDYITPEDFDGDGRDDFAVWTEAAATVANFKILQSSTNTVVVQTFGQNGDDPAIVGDYDGDNKADPAVYRCPAIGDPAGQCFFFYRGSLNNPAGNITYVPWGSGNSGDFFPYIGDFDGDGKYDFCIQRSNPASPSNGQFVLKRSSDGGVEYINWGTSSDFIIPGDYDGDGRSDFCVRRTVSGSRHHWILYRTGATDFRAWGAVGDVSAPGDYDGDGKTDLAIWRPNVDPTMNFFWILNSSNGSVTNVEWGQCGSTATCDFAVAGWAVH